MIVAEFGVVLLVAIIVVLGLLIVGVRAVLPREDEITKHVKSTHSGEPNKLDPVEAAVRQTVLEMGAVNRGFEKRFTARKALFSNAEVQFHRVLIEAVPDAAIFPKVRLADIVDVPERYSGDFLRISQKHFDWVVCDPRNFKPLVAIELDDASHRWSSKQKKSDGVKNDVASEAGLVMLRFPWQRSYDADAVRERVVAAVNSLADRADAA